MGDVVIARPAPAASSQCHDLDRQLARLVGDPVGDVAIAGLGAVAGSRLPPFPDGNALAARRSERVPSRSRFCAGPISRLMTLRGGIPAATRRTWIKRSTDTTRTSCSTRSTPHARTRHMTPRAHCVPIFGGVVTARPPARAPERDGADRTTLSSSRPGRQFRLGRSPPSQCLPDRARGASGAAASPPPPAGRARAGRHPRSAHRPDSGERARTSGARTGRAQRRE